MPFGRSHTCQPFLTPKTSLPEPAGTRPGAASAPGLPAIPACCRAAVARVRGILTAHPAIGHHASILRRAVGSPRSTAALIIVLGVFFCSTAAAQTAHFRGAQSTVPTSGLNFPNGVAVDGSGNVYIADTDNNRVLKETLSAGSYTQSIVADAASGGLYVPYAVAVDGSGNVYIADTGNGRVLMETLSASGYTQSIVADAASGGLDYPERVAVDGSGNVYIADSGNSRVLMETLSNGNFGPVNLGSRSSNPISAIFTFDTAGTLNSWVEVAQGATALDFTDAGTSTCNPVAAYTAGETCAVGVAFTPARAGTRYGAVELLNLSGDVIATGYVQGTGVGPLVNFLPGTQSIVANYANNGLNNPYLPVVQLAIFQLGMHQTLIERLRS